MQKNSIFRFLQTAQARARARAITDNLRTIIARPSNPKFKIILIKLVIHIHLQNRCLGFLCSIIEVNMYLACVFFCEKIDFSHIFQICERTKTVRPPYQKQLKIAEHEIRLLVPELAQLELAFSFYHQKRQNDCE